MDKKHKDCPRRELTRQLYQGNRLCFSINILRCFLLAGTNLLLSWLMQQFVDIVTGTGADCTFGDLMAVSAVNLGMFSATFFLAYHSTPRLSSRAMEQYKNYAFQQISRKNIAAFTGENTAVYVSALSNDVNTIREKYLGNIANLVFQAVLFAGSLAMMLWYSVPLTLISLGFALLPVVAALLTGDRVAEKEKTVSEKNEVYMAALQDSLAGFPVVKVFRAEKEMCRLFARQVREVAKAECASRKMTILVDFFGSMGGITAQLGVFAVGAWMGMTGQGVSAGVVVVFVQLMNFVIGPIGTVPQYLAEIKSAQILMDKLANALDRNVREEGKTISGKLEQGIRVENLCFGYGEAQVLQEVDFTFEAGKRYAIVGASGSGKSTLLNLLMAAHENYSGSIRYDGVELRDISSESLYELVSLVQQNVFVFNASIRDNITMFRDFPKEEVDRAIALSGLSALIEEKGEGYLCGENGSGLSGGEKQRISIARSLLRRSQVLLVDEATAALDPQTAWQVSSGILDLDGLTRIVVTHSLDGGLLKRFDSILTLKNGRIAERGSFEELMERKGYFYSLVYSFPIKNDCPPFWRAVPLFQKLRGDLHGHPAVALGAGV